MYMNFQIGNIILAFRTQKWNCQQFQLRQYEVASYAARKQSQEIKKIKRRSGMNMIVCEGNQKKTKKLYWNVNNGIQLEMEYKTTVNFDK